MEKEQFLQGAISNNSIILTGNQSVLRDVPGDLVGFLIIVSPPSGFNNYK